MDMQARNCTNADIYPSKKYRLTPVPYSLATADGYLAKTNKAKAFCYLTKDCDDAGIPPSGDTLTIQDGNATFYQMRKSPANFTQIDSIIFDIIGKTDDAVISTDQYLPGSVQFMESKRRGCGEKLLLKEGATNRPPDWKSFMSNDENKTQFIQLLLKMWNSDKYALSLQGRQVIFICEGKAHLLTSEDGQTAREMLSLRSSQEETDTRVILYMNYARSKNYHFVRMKSPDSDIFFILLHYAAPITDITILFDTGMRNKQGIIDVSKIAKE